VRAVHRYEVSVDDHAHDIELHGPIVHVDCRNPDRVEIWAMTGVQQPMVRTFQVFGTGQPLPDNAAHIGTALAGRGGTLVWHLFELLVGTAAT
jgi:hypothetical protein